MIGSDDITAGDIGAGDAAVGAGRDADRSADPDDALVAFMPSGRRGRFKLGTPLLDAARALGVYVESVCGGRGICGRCQVTPSFGAFAKLAIDCRPTSLSAFNEIEQRYARLRSLPADRRLSCQARVMGDVIVDVPADTAVNRQVVRKRAEMRAVERDPAVRACVVEIEAPSMEQPLGDLDRVFAALARDHGLSRVTADPTLLALVQRRLRAGAAGGDGGRYRVTAIVHEASGAPPVLLDLRPGDDAALFGVAVDIGSTTIACHLVDLASGRTVASSGTSNPQIRFGEDLMSRVSYVMMNPGGTADLTRVVREAIMTLIARVASEAGIQVDAVLEAVVVGNPIMHHLVLGIDPTELGQAPFALAVSGALSMPSRAAGLDLHPAARLYVLPCIAGHVGADAAAVALAEGPQHHDETTLVVDIGTNAEILLGTRERVLAASSPTGPAFEGAEISAGQRAAPGAIERVRIDPATLEPVIRVIGCDAWSNEPGFSDGSDAFGVTGVCGSGIIEAVAEMFLAGIVTSDGIIDPRLAARSDRIVIDGRTASYILWRGSAAADAASASGPASSGPHIRITQGDIRAIQLAKAALYAGCRLLMDRLGVASVERIKLAGAFGSYIEPKHAMVLGLIPDCDLSRVSSVGNAAGTGARMALLSRRHRDDIEALVRRIEKIETAIEPRFQEHFVAAMALPNKVEPFPNLARVVDLPAPSTTTGTDRPRRRGARPVSMP